jgi:peroxiredoxin
VQLQAGDPLPDIALADANGRPVELSSLRGRGTLILFLRHLGCLPCREHLLQVVAAQAWLGVRVACVTFSKPGLLEGFRRELGLDADTILLSDHSREAYRAFGFERGSIRRVWLDLRVWRRYAHLIAHGRRPRLAHQDTLQLGGDVLSDASGRIVWIYRSSGPEDRPRVEDLRQAAQARGALPADSLGRSG